MSYQALRREKPIYKLANASLQFNYFFGAQHRLEPFPTRISALQAKSRKLKRREEVRAHGCQSQEGLVVQKNVPPSSHADILSQTSDAAVAVATETAKKNVEEESATYCVCMDRLGYREPSIWSGSTDLNWIQVFNYIPPTPSLSDRMLWQGSREDEVHWVWFGVCTLYVGM